MKIRPGLFICVIISAVVAVLRTYQILFVIDPATGFYSSGNFSVPLLNTILVAATVYFVLYRFLLNSKERKIGLDTVIFQKSKARSIISFLIAAAFIFHAFNLALSPNDFTVSPAQWILPAFAVLSALFFAVLGGACLYGRTPSSGVGALAILPLIWAALELIIAFLQYTTIANISAQLFDVLYMVAIILFLFFHGKGIARLGDASGVVAFGFCTILFLAATAIPRTVVEIINGTFFSDLKETSLLILNILLLVYILSTLFILLRAGKTAET